MSMEEDSELRDLVAQTLEVHGCLPKIRAELRASIFLALDEDEELQKHYPLLNKKVKTQLESPEGRAMFCLVREFLEFFDLDFTISVYEPESYMGTGYQYEGRSKVIEDLGISQLEENPALPLLLQLIQIAQLSTSPQTKNINIDLIKIQNEGCNADEDASDGGVQNKPNSNNLKTEEADVRNKSTTSISEELEHSEVSRSINENSVNGFQNPTTEIHVLSKNSNINETFNLSSPSVCFDESKKSEMCADKQKPLMEVILSPRSMNSSKSDSEEKDDTYEGTSSIAEDSTKEQPLLDLDKSTHSSEKSQNVSETEFSPPILKDCKTHSKFDISFEKLKLSPQKTEKLKPKGSLSSLADLPPLQLNKSRNDTVLLPSLYSREFKEKASNQNLKEIDKFFDVDVDLDNYEEDFMSESEINLNKSLDSSRANFVDELQSLSITDSNKNISSISVPSADARKVNVKSPLLQKTKLNSGNTDSIEFSQQSEQNRSDITVSPKHANGIRMKDNSTASSSTSDETNLNIDDILNSPTSN